MFKLLANMFPKAEVTEEPGSVAIDAQAQETVSILQAINAHVRWKRNLLDYVNGNNTETLDPLNIARDDECHLGQWMHGIGAESYGECEAFESLRSNHAAFHRCAGEVVALMQSGKKPEAESLLHGEFVRVSKSVVNDLLRINTTFGLQQRVDIDVSAAKL